jgi:hypothetical protein
MINMAAETALICKLRALDREFTLPDGLTTIEQRRDVVRDAIKPWLDVVYTIRNGRQITMRMQFADAYGEVLE